MLKLCTLLIGVQSALVRRDDHHSELQQQEEKKAAPVVQPASTPDGNLAALWGCKTDENCVPHHDLPLEVAKMAEKECPDSPTCKYAAYCKCAPLVQPASTPEWDRNLAAPAVQPASSMIESSSDADAEMPPTKALTFLLGAGALVYSGSWFWHILNDNDQRIEVCFRGMFSEVCYPVEPGSVELAALAHHLAHGEDGEAARRNPDSGNAEHFGNAEQESMHVGPNNDNDLLASLTPTDNDLPGPESMDVGPNNDPLNDYLKYRMHGSRKARLPSWLHSLFTPTDNDLPGPESVDVGPNNDYLNDYLNYRMYEGRKGRLPSWP